MCKKYFESHLQKPSKVNEIKWSVKVLGFANWGLKASALWSGSRLKISWKVNLFRFLETNLKFKYLVYYEYYVIIY